MAKRQRVIVLKTGEEFPIVGENGRYWLCEGANFRKSNREIQEIKELKAEKPVRKEAEAQG